MTRPNVNSQEKKNLSSGGSYQRAEKAVEYEGDGETNNINFFSHSFRPFCKSCLIFFFVTLTKYSRAVPHHQIEFSVMPWTPLS